MSKLVPRSCFLRGSYKGLFDFRQDFEQSFHRSLISWPFSEAPPAAF